MRLKGKVVLGDGRRLMAASPKGDPEADGNEPQRNQTPRNPLKISSLFEKWDAKSVVRGLLVGTQVAVRP